MAGGTPLGYRVGTQLSPHAGPPRLQPQAYDGMLKAQGGVCRICRHPEAFCDGSGQPLRLSLYWNGDRFIRGLLCKLCTTGLSMFRDDPALLAAAITFLTACERPPTVEARYHDEEVPCALPPSS